MAITLPEAAVALALGLTVIGASITLKTCAGPILTTEATRIVEAKVVNTSVEQHARSGDSYFVYFRYQGMTYKMSTSQDYAGWQVGMTHRFYLKTGQNYQWIEPIK